MSCSHITLLFLWSRAWLNRFSSANSPRRPIAFLPTLIWHRVQVLGRKVPSMTRTSTWRKVFLRLQVSTRLARFFARDTTYPLTICRDGQTAFTSNDPEPQIVAEAIAAFQHNIWKRAGLNLPQLDTMTVGTRPFVYQVPVTQQLSDCVAAGQFSPQPTVVILCALYARRRASEGMEVQFLKFPRTSPRCIVPHDDHTSGPGPNVHYWVRDLMYGRRPERIHLALGVHRHVFFSLVSDIRALDSCTLWRILTEASF